MTEGVGEKGRTFEACARVGVPEVDGAVGAWMRDVSGMKKERARRDVPEVASVPCTGCQCMSFTEYTSEVSFRFGSASRRWQRKEKLRLYQGLVHELTKR